MKLDEPIDLSHDIREEGCYFVNMWAGGGGAHPHTREEWLHYARDEKLKPPNSWLALQETKGRTKPAVFRIWWDRYDQGKRVLAWLYAPLDDFIAAGYVVRR